MSGGIKHAWSVETCTSRFADPFSGIVRWTAVCSCGWSGPERSCVAYGVCLISPRTMEQAAIDGVDHVRQARAEAAS